MTTTCEIRYPVHPEDVRLYDTARIRREFLVSSLFEPETVRMVYSMQERFIVGGITTAGRVALQPTAELRAAYFLERRELGIINVGGPGQVIADGLTYDLGFNDALYLGRGVREVLFCATSPGAPPKFYFNSAPAHKALPARKVTLNEAEKAEMGSEHSSNRRTIYKLLVNSVVETCQLQMGLTRLQPGSVWNTMPPHLHTRRNEVYFYFDLPDSQVISHFMGQPVETRHLWVKNEEAVISPVWSLHSAAGTASYAFIWGMAGENLDYSDMDAVSPVALR